MKKYIGTKEVFQHTAARRRLDESESFKNHEQRFNTQPPEGGWLVLAYAYKYRQRFQHTAARRRLAYIGDDGEITIKFQHTAARRRLVPLQAPLSFPC